MAAPWLTSTHNTVVAAPVELTDVMPTIASLAGVAMPTNDTVPVEGTSLVPLMVGDDGGGDRFALTQFPRCVGGLAHLFPRDHTAILAYVLPPI